MCLCACKSQVTTSSGNAALLFRRLFENHSELITLFTKFRQLRTRDEQAESLELAEHATIVMNSIDEGIKAMDNVDFFFDLLHQIGASHRKIPGFKKEYFWKIEHPFLEAVRLTLGDRYTDNMDNIYRITIKFLIETVVRGYEKAEKEPNDNVKKAINSEEGNSSSKAAKGS
ncbi:neuroglobin-like [Eriocheir sinensis]|uniref:neuroglobin-like n=1 Tax=Eriocheir sinensis TaxID=95602 RepID=UPI0021C85019|nr:neuroglobin-like [Eriocheir sinensis]